MNRILVSTFAAACAAAFVHAAPADDLAAAAKKLGDAANYSWTATTEIANSQFPAMPVEGQTEKGGLTVITRSFNGNAMQTVRKGDQMVMQNQEGAWMTMEEMRAQFANRGGGGAPGAGGAPGGGGNRGGGGGRGGPGMFGGGQANPAEEVANLVAKIKDAGKQFIEHKKERRRPIASEERDPRRGDGQRGMAAGDLGRDFRRIDEQRDGSAGDDPEHDLKQQQGPVARHQDAVGDFGLDPADRG